MTSGENSEIHAVGPEFCGGALSKGGNMIAEESDNVGRLIQSKVLKIFKPKFVMICKTINDKNIFIEYVFTMPYIFR